MASLSGDVRSFLEGPPGRAARIEHEAEAWGQSVDDLRRLAIDSPHPRTRERFQALFMIASGAANASAWAKRIGREDETVPGWARTYNAAGPQALAYRRTGGAPPFRPTTTSERSPRS